MPAHAPAQLEVEEAAVEVEALVEVADLEHHVVDSPTSRATRSRGTHRLPSVAAIELDGLERRYGERVALAGVSVRVEAGQTLAVLGGNGAGKTTLLRVLAGLLRPHGGRAGCSAPSCPASAGSCPAGSATSATSRCSTAS